MKLREIEKALTAELQTTRERVRTATIEEEKAKAMEAFNAALQRFRHFVTKGYLP